MLTWRAIFIAAFCLCLLLVVREIRRWWRGDR